uniref:Uncharacterized protein n=1 Tax=Compsopogon caeruleus TaxID=31354 RepID=A0A7S1XFE4_9RHOD|mmetsp:Transcript_3381/g.6345  ORF Transcript_3381/g.6345 Transcript_3381/m.6345 type:complete len:164 (+) Transcript_3381:448-939(+)|eukprot:CAMPEP_0184679274 /NCGR_PEP_ID=MMETSP0312-20130426/2089_1 /TAXON_ID=31354 /ORGANISM="Compsopogon coeruleus, Strain SAG 36.94" /LENGTH=163 /DNA_ID=CAMNT_0027128601 /DNA_START=681 /DNA_END=1172 /DNA_ORIENTATION=-
MRGSGVRFEDGQLDKVTSSQGLTSIPFDPMALTENHLGVDDSETPLSEALNFRKENQATVASLTERLRRALRDLAAAERRVEELQKRAIFLECKNWRLSRALRDATQALEKHQETSIIGSDSSKDLECETRDEGFSRRSRSMTLVSMTGECTSRPNSAPVAHQ